jgi:Mor family transcriptional regulator
LKYINAAEVLPDNLLNEIQRYVNGEVLYIPSIKKEIKWGDKNGTRQFFESRNRAIKQKFQNGNTIEQLAQDYGLAYETVRKIVYRMK